MQSQIKICLFIWVFAGTYSSIAFAQTKPTKFDQEPPKDTVLIGVYINSLYDLKFPEKEYAISMWVWLLYKNDSLDVADNIEIVNAKTAERSDVIHLKEEGWNYVSMKFQLVMQQPWETANFPFDAQNLKIRIEDGEHDYRELALLPDTANSGYDHHTYIQGWEIKSFILKGEKSLYKTNYGDPSIKEKRSIYGAVNLYINIKRQSWGLFFKLFFGLYVSFSIGMLTFLVSPNDLEARFGLAVGAVFAAVGNKYIVDSILPESAVFALSDKIHAVTFFFIFLSILNTAFARYYEQRNRHQLAIRIDTYSLISLPVFFIGMNIWLILGSIS
jgi:hypothetical protein